MTCGFCVFEGGRRELHAHLATDHADRVATRVEEESGRMFYVLSCPKCDRKIENRVKPRWRDPDFLEEFSREIRLVAFDLLLYHLEEHEAVSGGAS